MATRKSPRMASSLAARSIGQTAEPKRTTVRSSTATTIAARIPRVMSSKRASSSAAHGAGKSRVTVRQYETSSDESDTASAGAQGSVRAVKRSSDAMATGSTRVPRATSSASHSVDVRGGGKSRQRAYQFEMNANGLDDDVPAPRGSRVTGSRATTQSISNSKGKRATSAALGSAQATAPDPSRSSMANVFNHNCVVPQDVLAALGLPGQTVDLTYSADDVFIDLTNSPFTQGLDGMGAGLRGGTGAGFYDGENNAFILLDSPQQPSGQAMDIGVDQAIGFADSNAAMANQGGARRRVGWSADWNEMSQIPLSHSRARLSETGRSGRGGGRVRTIGGSQADRAERGGGGVMARGSSEASSGLISGVSRGGSAVVGKRKKRTDNAAADQRAASLAWFIDRSDDSSDDDNVRYLPAVAFHVPVPASPPPMPIDTGSSGFAISCPVCFDTVQQVKSNGGEMMSDHCGHLLCNTCMDKVLKNVAVKPACPMCRRKFNKKTVHPCDCDDNDIGYYGPGVSTRTYWNKHQFFDE